MSDKIAISDLKTIANKYGLDHIICFATKGKQQYVATYGHTVEACDQAAQFGDEMKDGLGWPESLHAMPSRVKTLLARAEAAEQKLAERYTAYEAITNSMDVISGELKAANKDALQLAAQLELEQNPGYSCHELREHYKRVKNSQDEI